MTDRSLILSKIKHIIKSSQDLAQNVNVDELTENSQFKNDLYYDSLAMMSLVYELQAVYPSLEEEKALNWKRVADCIDTIIEVST